MVSIAGKTLAVALALCMCAPALHTRADAADRTIEYSVYASTDQSCTGQLSQYTFHEDGVCFDNQLSLFGNSYPSVLFSASGNGTADAVDG